MASKKRNSLEARALALIALAILALTGCGNDLKERKLTASRQTYSLNRPLLDPIDGIDPVTGDTASNLANYICPESTNVNPDYDWNLDGTGFYKVCKARANENDILVHGFATRNENETICVFPAQYYDQMHVVWKPDEKVAGPKVSCVQNSRNGAYLSFAGVTYNAAFIVSLADAAQMRTCLTMGNYYQCPKNYSFGVFR